jgi:TP901 family phage tail tape measure protein
MSHIEKPSKNLRDRFNQAQDKSEKLREKLFGQRRELDALGRALDKAGASTKDLARFEGELAAKAARASAAQKSLQESQAALTATRDRLKLSNIGAELAESGAIFLALKKPIQAAATFETTMAGIKKVVDFDSPEAFKAMGTDLQNLSLRIPMTTEALGKIYAAGGQSGIAQKDLLAFTEAAAKMGVAFEVTADQAGDWMAKWRTAFKMNQGQVTQLADQINYLGNNSGVPAAQISDVVSRVGPLGAVANVAAKQIAALGASMIGAGQSEEVAATGAKNFMLALTAGESATKKQREAFGKLNIDPEILAQEMMKDPEKVMTGILERISNVDKAQQSALLAQIFGKGSVDAISPLLSNIENLKRNMALVSGEGPAGSVEKEFAAFANTATNSFQLALNAANAFSRQIGDALLPSVKSAAIWLVNVGSAVLKFSQAHPEAFNMFVKGIAAFGALRVAKNVTSILGTAVKLPYLEAKTAVLSLRGAWIAADGNLLTMIKNTKIAKAVTKTYAGVQWLLKKAMKGIGWIRSKARIIAHAIAMKASAAATKLHAGAQWLLGKAMKAGQWLLSTSKLIAHKIATLASAAATKAWAAAQWLWSKAMAAGQWLLSAGKLLAYKAAQIAVAVASKAWAAAQWLLNAALTANPIGLIIIAVAALVGAFIYAYKKIDWFRKGVNAVFAKVKEIFMAGVEYVSALFEKLGIRWDVMLSLFLSGPAIIGSLIAGIKEKFTAGFEKIAALIDAVGQKWEKFKTFLGIAPAIPEPRMATVAAQSAIAVRHAEGGMFNRPHLGLVAEDGDTESIIPHNPSGERIWRATGDMAGFSTGEEYGAGSAFSTTINLNVTAAPGANGNEIGRQIIRAIEQELPRLLRRYEEQRLRVEY